MQKKRKLEEKKELKSYPIEEERFISFEKSINFKW